MKTLSLLLFLMGAPAFAEEIVEAAHDKKASVYASVVHDSDTTRAERARFHFDRLHVMLSAIESNRPLQPLPPMTVQDAMNVQIEVNVGDDVSVSRR